MSEQNIDITLKTVGADEASGEIKKVEDAEVKLADAEKKRKEQAAQPSRGMNGQLEAMERQKAAQIAAQAEAQRKLNEAKDAEVKTITKKVEAVTKETKAERDLTEVLEKKSKIPAPPAAAPATPAVTDGAIGAKIDKIDLGQKALAAAKLAEQLTKIGPKLEKIGKDIGGVDGELGKTLETTGKVIAKSAEAISTVALGYATGGPVGAALAGAGLAIGELVTAWVDYTASAKAAQDATEGIAEQENHIAERRKFKAENSGEHARLMKIREQNTALHDQEESVKRLADLEQKRRELAATAASQEVKLAKLKGGDVALAEANALAADFTRDIGVLKGGLNAARNNLATATSDNDRAMGNLKEAMKKVAADSKAVEAQQLPQLRETAAKATEALTTARTALGGIKETYTASVNVIIQDAEISLAEKEQEYAGKISGAADKAFTNFDTTLRSAASEAVTQTSTLGTEVATAGKAATDAVKEGMKTAATEQSTALTTANKTATDGVTADVKAAATEQATALTEQLKAASAAEAAQVSQSITAHQLQVTKVLANCAVALAQSQTQERAVIKLEEASRANSQLLVKTMSTYIGIQQAMERLLQQNQKDIQTIYQRLNRR